MSDRTTQVESSPPQTHAKQGLDLTFAGFVNAVAGELVSDIKEAPVSKDKQDIGQLIFDDLKALHGDTDQAVYARNAQVDDLIHLQGQGKAVFKVTGRTMIDPPDNVEVELVSDPYSEAHFKSGDLSGGEWVCIVQS